MKSSKKLIKTGIIAIPAIIALTATAPSFAEFRVGAEVGASSTSLGLAGASGDINGGTLGAFWQWRFAASDTTSLGIHLGYAFDSTDSSGSAVGSATVSDGITTVTITEVTGELEINSTYDLLGIVAWERDGFNPFIMAGYSSISSDLTGNVVGTITENGATRNVDIVVDEDDSASGWKIAVGTEFPFSGNESLIGHVVLDYADYGDEIFGVDLEEFDKTSIRFGVSYRY